LAIPVAPIGDPCGDWDRHQPSVQSPPIATGIAKHPWMNRQTPSDESPPVAIAIAKRPSMNRHLWRWSSPTPLRAIANHRPGGHQFPLASSPTLAMTIAVPRPQVRRKRASSPLHRGERLRRDLRDLARQAATGGFTRASSACASDRRCPVGPGRPDPSGARTPPAIAAAARRSSTRAREARCARSCSRE
jgi:hypothetical protein